MSSRGPRRTRRLLPALLLAALAASFTATAQVNPFKQSGFDLSVRDLELLEAAAARLYVGETATLGTVETWENPESGNSGTVVLTGIFSHSYQGSKLPCRRLRHDIRIKSNATPFRFVVNRCRIQSGEWKIL